MEDLCIAEIEKGGGREEESEEGGGERRRDGYGYIQMRSQVVSGGGR